MFRLSQQQEHDEAPRLLWPLLVYEVVWGRSSEGLELSQAQLRHQAACVGV